MIFSYLDAGSGSLLLQALVGGFAGLAVAFKAWRGKLKQRRGVEEPEVGDEAHLTSES